MDEELLPADLVAQAKAMWGSTLWQKVVRYVRTRRDELVSACDPPVDQRAIWIREGQLAELNRFLRGDAFLLDVLSDTQARHLAEARQPPGNEPAPPPWMKFHSDVVN